MPVACETDVAKSYDPRRKRRTSMRWCAWPSAGPLLPFRSSSNHMVCFRSKYRRDRLMISNPRTQYAGQDSSHLSYEPIVPQSSLLIPPTVPKIKNRDAPISQLEIASPSCLSDPPPTASPDQAPKSCTPRIALTQSTSDHAFNTYFHLPIPNPQLQPYPRPITSTRTSSKSLLPSLLPSHLSSPPPSPPPSYLSKPPPPPTHNHPHQNSPSIHRPSELFRDHE